MNIKIHIASLIGILLLLVSCNDDNENIIEPGENRIQLSAMSLRANGDVYPNLYLTAVVAENPSVTYIPQTPISLSGGLYEENPTDITFTDGSPYYPLGDNDIFFYAYSGQLNNNGRIVLTSGRQIANDAILSNQGFRSNDLTTLTPEGEGTPGSSANPAEILQFRHLMTKVNIVIKVDSTETPHVDPPPASVQFRLDGVRATGTYSITQLAPVEGDEENASVAGNRSGEYTIREGVNYLVPTGRDLTQLAFTRLIIDDYTATAEDLAALSINYVDGNTRALMVPGYAYNITFNIRRLKVPSVTVEKIDWDAVEVTNEDITYDPYTVTLDLGDYSNTGTDAVVKAVLWTNNNEQYVGELNKEGTGISFVSLPATGTVDSVSLYTKLGLLIGMAPDNYTYSETGSVLTAPLSEVGMRLLDSSAANSENNPYLVETPVQIFNIGKDLTASYRLVNDVDIDRLIYTNEIPLGPLETFSGIFDGNGYQVQNLMVTGPALLKRNEGTIKNLRLSAGRINAAGESVVGSVCAVNAGTLVACFNEARIAGATGIVGGICGTNEATGKVIACVNTGNIDNGVTLGGICGNNLNTDASAFVSCINTGLLTKDGTVIGGILGNSTTSINSVIINSFWLVGTAAYVFGGNESAVGSPDFVGVSDVTALSPEKLRESISDDPNDVLETLMLLNQALETTVWGADYEYMLNQNITGSVWPVPVKRD